VTAALQARFIEDRGSAWINAYGIEVQQPDRTPPTATNLSLGDDPLGSAQVRLQVVDRSVQPGFVLPGRAAQRPVAFGTIARSLIARSACRWALGERILAWPSRSAITVGPCRPAGGLWRWCAAGRVG
jgi:hypothetical protein